MWKPENPSPGGGGRLQTFLYSNLFIYLIYPIISFALHGTLAVVFNMMWWQSVAWNFAMDASGGNRQISLLVGMVTFSMCFVSQASIIGMFVTFMAEKVYKETPSFNEDKRPTYTPEERLRGHQIFFKNATLSIIVLTYLTAPVRDPLGGREPFVMAPLVQDITGIRSALFKYVLLTVMVQTALILSDVLYAVLHVFQHKITFLHDWTGHSYHHQFRYPLALCGPWLAPADMAVSALFTFVLPIQITLTTLGFRRLMGGWYAHDVLQSLLFGFIHEMNDSDHCGKQLPTWSGFPLCPPLGFALGLHMSIPNHEAHHNFSNSGFGLLGVGDWLMGTTGRLDSNGIKADPYDDDSGDKEKAVAESSACYFIEEVAKHITKDDCWIVVNGQVLDVTNFLSQHPGGENAIFKFAGKDATQTFNRVHSPDMISEHVPHAIIGSLGVPDVV